jgi:hypothetical protein
MKTSTTDITNRELLEAMTQQLGIITDNMVTKKDLREVLQDYPTKRDLKEILKDYATKDDLKRFATKEDLKRFATKDDLKRFATKEDLKRFATKDDLKGFATKKDAKGFATKDDMKALGERMERGFTRLERKISASHSANVAHHLETRDMIGDLYRKTGWNGSSRKSAGASS